MTIAYFFDHLATESDTAVMVQEEDFLEAHRELVPSVSADELGHYERVRRTFEGAGKKEDRQSNGDRKGKGKAVAPVEGGDVDGLVVQMDGVGIEGQGASASAKGKGKGKAPAGHAHARDDSRDIAEGGFGSAADGDEELYS